MNSQQLRIVADTRHASAASHALQERLEQVRSANWKQVIDGDYLTGTLLSAPPKSVAPLIDYRESITVTGWPAGNGTVLRVTKQPKSEAKIETQSGDLATERLLKIIVQLKWDGPGGTPHTRELATILSNGGISRVNLPAMGPIGGGSWDAATDATPIGDPADEEPTTDSGGSGGGSTGNGSGAGGGAGSNGSGNGGFEGAGSNSNGNGGGSDSGNGSGESKSGSSGASEKGSSNAGGNGRGNVGGASGVK